MDQIKNQGQQSQDRNEPQTPLQNPTRDQPEGPRQSPGPQKPRNPPERGSGISNRGIGREEEQEDLPDRGSERQSER